MSTLPRISREEKSGDFWDAILPVSLLDHVHISLPMCTLSHGHDVRRSLTSCTSSLFPEDFHQFLPINKYLDLFSMRQLMSSLIIVISGRVQVSEKSVIHPRLMIFTICFSLTELSSTTEEFRKGSHKDLRLQENYGKLHRDLNGISAIPRVIDRQP